MFNKIIQKRLYVEKFYCSSQTSEYVLEIRYKFYNSLKFSAEFWKRGVYGDNYKIELEGEGHPDTSLAKLTQIANLFESSKKSKFRVVVDFATLKTESEKKSILERIDQLKKLVEES